MRKQVPQHACRKPALQKGLCLTSQIKAEPDSISASGNQETSFAWQSARFSIFFQDTNYEHEYNHWRANHGSIRLIHKRLAWSAFDGKSTVMPDARSAYPKLHQHSFLPGKLLTKKKHTHTHTYNNQPTCKPNRNAKPSDQPGKREQRMCK